MSVGGEILKEIQDTRLKGQLTDNRPSLLRTTTWLKFRSHHQHLLMTSELGRLVSRHGVGNFCGEVRTMHRNDTMRNASIVRLMIWHVEDKYENPNWQFRVSGFDKVCGKPGTSSRLRRLRNGSTPGPKLISSSSYLPLFIIHPYTQKSYPKTRCVPMNLRYTM